MSGVASEARRQRNSLTVRQTITFEAATLVAVGLVAMAAATVLVELIPIHAAVSVLFSNAEQVVRCGAPQLKHAPEVSSRTAHANTSLRGIDSRGALGASLVPFNGQGETTR